MYSYIVNPNTQKKISLFGQEGGNILANYVNIYKQIRKSNKNENNQNENNKNSNNLNKPQNSVKK
jgi:hypothetical protein